MFDYDDNPFLRGRKEIMRFLKIKSWRTIQKYRKRKSLPILRWINGQPMMLKIDAVTFLIKFNEILKKNEERENKK